MEIEIETSKGKRNVKIEYPGNKDIERMWDALEKVENCESKERIASIRKMRTVRLEITLKLCDLPKEDFDNLTSIESDKLTGFVAEEAFKDLDFTRLFKKQVG